MKINEEKQHAAQRFLVRLSFLGTHFSGWQRQPNAMSVQEKLETVFSEILNQPIEITGCGRTDAGVHAQNYVAHFDFLGEKLPSTFLRGVNGKLGADIAVHRVAAVPPDTHARFDAIERAYDYQIIFEKNPFRQFTSWHFEQGKHFDFDAMQTLAERLRQQRDFFIFCKTDSGLDSFECDVREARWHRQPDGWRFEVAANRFLRGMVRLIVGASVQVGLGKLSMEEVEKALETRTYLPKSLSVPPQGLILNRVEYPDAIEQILH